MKATQHFNKLMTIVGLASLVAANADASSITGKTYVTRGKSRLVRVVGTRDTVNTDTHVLTPVPAKWEHSFRLRVAQAVDKMNSEGLGKLRGYTIIPSGSIVNAQNRQVEGYSCGKCAEKVITISASAMAKYSQKDMDSAIRNALVSSVQYASKKAYHKSRKGANIRKNLCEILDEGFVENPDGAQTPETGGQTDSPAAPGSDGGEVTPPVSPEAPANNSGEKDPFAIDPKGSDPKEGGD